MDTFTLQSFVTLAELGSFTRAAEKLNRTQSAISQQINKLENQLGKKLYMAGKVFSLTPDGQDFLSYAKKIVSLEEEMLHHFNQPDLSGEVKFGIPEDFAAIYLSEILVNFSRIHPKILLNIECDLTLNLFKKFKNQELDLVLLKMSIPKSYKNATDVCSEKLIWVGQDQFSNFKNIEALPLIVSPQPCVYRKRAIDILEKQKKSWRIAFSSHSYSGMIAAVKAGLGVCVLPKSMIPADIKGMILPDYPVLTDTHISLLKHNNKNKAVSSFEKFVFEKLNR